jgi:hypothetical protein
VRYAEERIDTLVKDLQDIEHELSLLIHRSKKSCMNTHSPEGYFLLFFGLKFSELEKILFYLDRYTLFNVDCRRRKQRA